MNRFKGIICALTSAASFGLVPFFTMPLILDEAMGKASILIYRFGIATLAIGLMALIARKSFKVSLRELAWLAILGVLYAGTSLGLIYSYLLIPTGTATTIHFLYPVLVALVMIIFFGEHSGFTFIVAALISLLGVGLMAFGGGGTGSLLGLIYVLTTVVTYALYIVAIEKTGLARLDSLVFTFYVLIFGVVTFTVFALSTGGVEPISSIDTLMPLLAVGLISTAFSDLALVIGVRNAGPTATAILGSCEPLVALVAGWMFFAEPLGVCALMGFLLIVTAVMIVVLKPMRTHVKN